MRNPFLFVTPYALLISVAGQSFPFDQGLTLAIATVNRELVMKEMAGETIN
jgi:hypothetical protein